MITTHRESGKPPIKRQGRHWWQRMLFSPCYLCPECGAALDMVERNTSRAPQYVGRKSLGMCECYHTSEYRCGNCGYVYTYVSGPYYPL